MFLDANNFYYIEDAGIYMFIPELGQVVFYAEKPDKTIKVKSIVLDRQSDPENPGQMVLTNKIIFPDSEIKGTSVYGKFRSMLQGKVNIFFESEQNPELFIKFFNKERLEKLEYVKARKQIDYLLVIKHSEKPGHTSKPENRILRIDWYNNIVKYYGEKEQIKLVDFNIPKGIKTGMQFRYTFLNGVESNEFFKSNSVSSITNLPLDKLEEYKHQLLLNGYGQSLDTKENNTKYFRELLQIFKRQHIVPSRCDEVQFKNFLSLLNTSGLKTNFYNTELFEKYIKEILEKPNKCTLDNLTLAPEDTFDEIKFKSYIWIPKENLEESMKEKVLNIDIYVNTNLSVEMPSVAAASPRPVVTTSDSATTINFNLQETLAGLTDKNTLKCGASNCYFVVKGSNGKDYGLRISSKIYSLHHENFINFVTENAVNSACHYYTSLVRKTIGREFEFPEISEILKFGIIEVNYKTEDSPEQLTGYIPYTVSNYNPNQQQLKDYISNVVSKKTDECAITLFIKNLLEKVYNFYTVMIPYFKFSHFDFKTDNILIDEQTEQLFIIDFGNAQINIYSDNEIYFLKNRKQLERYSAYTFYIKNVNNVYYSDNDIELLIWFLINNFKQTDTSGHSKNYSKIANDTLNLIKPMNDNDRVPAGNETTSLGFLLSSFNWNNFKGSLILYRLYQIYLSLCVVRDKCSDKYQCNLLKKDEENYFQKYIINYDEKNYIYYQSIFNDLNSLGQATSEKFKTFMDNLSVVAPANNGEFVMVPGASHAGGSKTKKQNHTYIQSNKYKSKTHKKLNARNKRKNTSKNINYSRKNYKN